MLRCNRCRRAFTLVELLVVIAIVGILLGLLLPAIQRARDASIRARCESNLKQLTLAVHGYETAFGSMPPWFVNNAQSSSWFIFLMPFMEYGSVYELIQKPGKAATAPPFSFPPGVYDNGNPPQTLSLAPGITMVTIPGTPAGPPVWTPTTTIGGYVTYSYVATPPATPSQTYYVDTTGTQVSPSYVYPDGTPYTGAAANHTAVWSWYAPGTGPVSAGSYSGYGVPKYTYKVLRCGADPSVAYPEGLAGGYGPTNYVANWNAFSDSNGNGSAPFGNWSKTGYNAPAQPFANITDGLSNTVFFAEAYAICNGVDRYAVYSWSHHNFGLSPIAIAPVQSTPLTGANGYPNAFLFQVRPTIISGDPNVCNQYLSQTGHAAMPVAMGDGSVRNVSGNVSQATWTLLMLPRDGQTLSGEEW
jgi:prepilin-type N-terminal cleavage/methylation domain-containing protein